MLSAFGPQAQPAAVNFYTLPTQEPQQPSLAKSNDLFFSYALSLTSWVKSQFKKGVSPAARVEFKIPDSSASTSMSLSVVKGEKRWGNRNYESNCVADIQFAFDQTQNIFTVTVQTLGEKSTSRLCGIMPNHFAGTSEFMEKTILEGTRQNVRDQLQKIPALAPFFA